ncbi:hypothetical protein [Bradyrhizobium sp.]|uniref:hypothetical protein n=1 Tax=Bradyrhizobium sp. TaxID=376 RepID=UPI002625D43D|nr:hypothetical protein [Bradyrhizobium sp.]
MSDLRPYRDRPATQLTAGARFIRGFTRIGAVVAVLVALTGGTITIFVAKELYNDATRSHESAQCVARLARAGYTFRTKSYSDALDYDVGGCVEDGLYRKSVREVIALADAPDPVFVTSNGAEALGYGMIVTGICAVVAYLASWLIGWMFAGFTKDA